MIILILKKGRTMYVASAIELEMWTEKYLVSCPKWTSQIISSAVPICSALC